MNRGSSPGKVYFVGAGPGNPGLLTIRGAECIAGADIILYDGLVNQALLRHANANAELMSVGKHGGSRIWQQSEINTKLVEEALSGKKVARLKGGDPVVFGRLAEECDALRSENIPFEVIPGITAALAAGGYAGIPITHRGHASAVALVTGHEEDGKSESAIDWVALAKFPGTVVVYMGVTTADRWTTSLMDAGMSPETPAALVRRCSWSDQEVVSCNLRDVASQISKLRPPVIVILGPVVELRPSMSWFDRKPLAGKTVLVTRAAEQANELVELLESAGAATRLQPTIELKSPSDLSAFDAVLNRIDSFAWIVFASANGVRYFINRLLATRRDTRCLANAKLACVGAKSADALCEFYLRADLVPEDFRAESLVESLRARVAGSQVLSVRTNRGRPILAKGLRDAGAILSEVIAYETYDIELPDPEIVAAIDAGHLDWVTVTSSGILNSLVNLLGIDRLSRLKIASISPITSEAVRALGLTTSAEASPHTMQGLVESMIEHVDVGESWRNETQR